MKVSTKRSARPFDWGWYGGDRTWLIALALQNYLNSCEVNCVPLLLTIVSGTPKLGSARVIVDILQKQLLTVASTKNVHRNDLASTEGFVDTKLRRKKTKSSKWETITY